ncbi:TPA: hypothetical protein ACIGVG_004467, partial [Salmonella enterica]
ALTVAASAVVSGSAMAWTASGSGGSLDMGGTLTPPPASTPWEVQVGSGTPVTGLDAPFTPGNTSVTIPVRTAIPFLGIRTKNRNYFPAQVGIRPVIEYANNAVSLTNVVSGNTSLTLNVTDASGAAIGRLTSNFGVAAGVLGKVGNTVAKKGVFAGAGQAFRGGLGNNTASVPADPKAFVNAFFPEATANFNDAGTTSWIAPSPENFQSMTPNKEYSAFYGSGIRAGENITITLTTAPTSSNIVWKASLPISVSYF